MNGGTSSPICINATMMDTYDIKTCSDCSPLMIEVQSLCRHDLCCVLEHWVSVNTSEGINCYWKQESTCVSLKSGLTDGEILANISERISCEDFNDSLSNISTTDHTALWSFNTRRNESIVAGQQNYRYLATEHGIDVSTCDGNTSASCVCEAFSGSPYHCFWNPNSRLTGEYCSRCEPLCRSQQHSIHFVQFVIGLSLVTYAYPMGRLSITLIASDALGTASQVSRHVSCQCTFVWCNCTPLANHIIARCMSIAALGPSSYIYCHLTMLMIASTQAWARSWYVH